MGKAGYIHVPTFVANHSIDSNFTCSCCCLGYGLGPGGGMGTLSLRGPHKYNCKKKRTMEIGPVFFCAIVSDPLSPFSFLGLLLLVFLFFSCSLALVFFSALSYAYIPTLLECCQRASFRGFPPNTENQPSCSCDQCTTSQCHCRENENTHIKVITLLSLFQRTREKQGMGR